MGTARRRGKEGTGMTAAKARATEPVPSPSPAPADERESFDAASRFITISGRGGSKRYFPVQARIDLLRHEAPDSTIDQELVQVTDQWAIFKATATRIIDGQVRGRADGYGHEFAKDFPDYVLKAATVAIGRALNALGYGGSDLDEGIVDGNVADAPTEDRRQPTPIDGGRRQAAPPKDERERENRRFHAVGASHGWTDEALHLLAVSKFDTQEDGTPTTSRAQLSASDLAYLSELIEKKIGRIVDPEGEILPTPEVEFANAIAKADPATLDGLATAMKESGILPKWLVMMGKTRKAALEATIGKVIDAAVGP